ncbi:MAG: hypothetical protein NVS9B12_02920 [Vulcanimicrobiaceae bacterium]
MESRAYRVLDERRGEFAALRNANVLIYWPHGLGDWIHLSAILPLLEPSNRYFVTRFGDDFVSALDNNAYARTIHSGTNAVSDGSPWGARHFGLDFKRVGGHLMSLAVPQPFAQAFDAAAIDTVLYTDYPETEGESKFPFHTKARKLLQKLLEPKRLATFDLAAPLASTVDFEVPLETQRLVDERLMRLSDPAKRLCVLSAGGHTAARKTWDAAEVARFQNLLRGADSRWTFFSLPDDYGALFSDTGLPFALVLKAILERTDLLVGVPAGPLHMAMARGNVPVVGIWLAHHPDWYEEPNPASCHLIGPDVTCGGFLKTAFDKRPASLSKPPSLSHHILCADGPGIPAHAVLAAASALL